MSIDHLVVRQNGVIGLAQAVRNGASARTVQRHASAGAWRRLRPAVYLVGGHRHDERAEVRAASLWAGEQATVTGPAAAFWHGMLPRAAEARALPGPVPDVLPQHRTFRLVTGR